MSEPPGYQIGFVSSKTGLSTHVIRAWERRYKAVEPYRSATGRRLFTTADIERLVLLKRAVARGHSISTIAGLENKALTALVETSAGPGGDFPADPVPLSDEAIQAAIAAGLAAIARLDGHALERRLNRAAVATGRQAFLERVVAPLMAAVGQQWSQGTGRIVFGHFAAARVHAKLVGMLAQPVDSGPERPGLLIAAPAGQCCYLGAAAVAVVVQDHGWRPVFIGSNLPAEEIAAAHAIMAPQMIALSITCRVNDDFMQAELRRLLDLIDDQCPIIVGGRASHLYRACAGGNRSVFGKTLHDLVPMLY